MKPSTPNSPVNTTNDTQAQRCAHTPGPWTLDEDGFISGPFSDGIRHDVCDPRCAPIELCAEMDANARLIASAPAMLAMLQDAAFQLGRLQGENLAIYARTFSALAASCVAQATEGRA